MAIKLKNSSEIVDHKIRLIPRSVGATLTTVNPDDMSKFADMGDGIYGICVSPKHVINCDGAIPSFLFVALVQGDPSNAPPAAMQAFENSIITLNDAEYRIVSDEVSYFLRGIPVLGPDFESEYGYTPPDGFTVASAMLYTNVSTTTPLRVSYDATMGNDGTFRAYAGANPTALVKDSQAEFEVCLSPSLPTEISCDGATNTMYFDQISGNFDVEINGDLYENTGNYNIDYFLNGVINRPYLQISSDGFMEVKNTSTTNPVRMRLIPLNDTFWNINGMSTNPTFMEDVDGSLVFCLSPAVEEPPAELPPTTSITCAGATNTFVATADMNPKLIEVSINDGDWVNAETVEGFYMTPSNPGVSITMSNTDTVAAKRVRLRSSLPIGLYVDPTRSIDQVAQENKSYVLYDDLNRVIDPTSNENHDYSGSMFDNTYTDQDYAVVFKQVDFCLSPAYVEPEVPPLPPITCDGANEGILFTAPVGFWKLEIDGMLFGADEQSMKGLFMEIAMDSNLSLVLEPMISEGITYILANKDTQSPHRIRLIGSTNNGVQPDIKDAMGNDASLEGAVLGNPTAMIEYLGTPSGRVSVCLAAKEVVEEPVLEAQNGVLLQFNESLSNFNPHTYDLNIKFNGAWTSILANAVTLENLVDTINSTPGISVKARQYGTNYGPAIVIQSTAQEGTNEFMITNPSGERNLTGYDLGIFEMSEQEFSDIISAGLTPSAEFLQPAKTGFIANGQVLFNLKYSTLPPTNPPTQISCDGAVEYMDVAIYADMVKMQDPANVAQVQALMMGDLTTINGLQYHVDSNLDVDKKPLDYIIKNEASPLSSEAAVHPDSNFAFMGSARLRNISGEDVRITYGLEHELNVINYMPLGTENPTMFVSDNKQVLSACLKAAVLPACTPTTTTVGTAPLYAYGTTSPCINYSINGGQTIKLRQQMDVTLFKPLQALYELIRYMPTDASYDPYMEGLLMNFWTAFKIDKFNGSTIEGFEAQHAESVPVSVTFYKDTTGEEPCDLFVKLFGSELDSITLHSCHNMNRAFTIVQRRLADNVTGTNDLSNTRVTFYNVLMYPNTVYFTANGLTGDQVMYFTADELIQGKFDIGQQFMVQDGNNIIIEFGPYVPMESLQIHGDQIPYKAELSAGKAIPGWTNEYLLVGYNQGYPSLPNQTYNVYVTDIYGNQSAFENVTNLFQNFAGVSITDNASNASASYASKLGLKESDLNSESGWILTYYSIRNNNADEVKVRIEPAIKDLERMSIESYL